MRRIFLLKFLIFLSSFYSDAQILKNLRYGVEPGISISTGPDVFSYFHSTINPLTAEYYYYKRYKLPALRLRTFCFKQVNDFISAGLKFGIDIHYLELNEYGQKETNFSFPLQLMGDSKALTISKYRALYFGINLGYDFRNINHYPFKEKGGEVFSAEIALNKISITDSHIYYKIGFEYEAGKYYFFFPGSNNIYQNEIIKTTQRRKQIYASVGVNF